jgi:hypothetical protein
VINAVVFDVGETLIDETREDGTWADWLGVPRHTFSAVGRDAHRVYPARPVGLHLGASS